jgi:hypothetical protein
MPWKEIVNTGETRGAIAQSTLIERGPLPEKRKNTETESPA